MLEMVETPIYRLEFMIDLLNVIGLGSMIYGTRSEKTCLWGFRNNTDADQPAHLPSLISAFVIPSLESTISKLATSKISFF